MTLHGAKDSDFKPVPYTRLAQCERKPRGEIDCPDIRRKGTTRLRQAQLVLTRMLRVFDIIAKKHGIRYWLYRGTLLGAVRHNGHIPFDNDVDICIPKPDFEKFVKYGTKELPDDIFFQTEETDRHWKIPPWTGMLGKLRDTRSCYKSCRGCGHNDGLQVDNVCCWEWLWRQFCWDLQSFKLVSSEIYFWSNYTKKERNFAIDRSQFRWFFSSSTARMEKHFTVALRRFYDNSTKRRTRSHYYRYVPQL